LTGTGDKLREKLRSTAVMEKQPYRELHLPEGYLENNPATNPDALAKSVNTLHFVIPTRGRNLAFTTGYKISPYRSR
jgi:hypothetical protein